MLNAADRADIYTSVLGSSTIVDGLFTRLRRKVDDEVRFQRELVAVRGALDMLLSANAALAS